MTGYGYRSVVSYHAFLKRWQINRQTTPYSCLSQVLAVALRRPSPHGRELRGLHAHAAVAPPQLEVQQARAHRQEKGQEPGPRPPRQPEPRPPRRRRPQPKRRSRRRGRRRGNGPGHRRRRGARPARGTHPREEIDAQRGTPRGPPQRCPARHRVQERGGAGAGLIIVFAENGARRQAPLNVSSSRLEDEPWTAPLACPQPRGARGMAPATATAQGSVARAGGRPQPRLSPPVSAEGLVWVQRPEVSPSALGPALEARLPQQARGSASMSRKLWLPGGPLHPAAPPGPCPPSPPPPGLDTRVPGAAPRGCVWGSASGGAASAPGSSLQPANKMCIFYPILPLNLRRLPLLASPSRCGNTTPGTRPPAGPPLRPRCARSPRQKKAACVRSVFIVYCAISAPSRASLSRMSTFCLPCPPGALFWRCAACSGPRTRLSDCRSG